ncbi:MAG TPA: hypothetical protein VGQ99_03510, partial [Tepidisphaeraceae bacterium]|nr:hypothetical protein [Tepidisphaeraceae bacterium]
MLYQFLIARFGETGWAVALMSIIGVLAGIVLWLVGARFSRSIVTLIAVSIGALVGLRLPAWFSVPVGAWSTAIGGALLLGISGYALHRMWVGAGLAALLAAWALVLVWNIYCTGRVGTFPDRVAGMGIGEYWMNLWNCLPTDFRRIGPFLGALAVIVGVTTAVFWSRAAAFMLYSVLGVSVLLIMGMLGIAISKPQLLGILPHQTGTQIATFGGMVLFGALVQW